MAASKFPTAGEKRSTEPRSMRQLRELGREGERPFDWDQLSGPERDAWERGAAEAEQETNRQQLDDARRRVRDSHQRRSQQQRREISPRRRYVTPARRRRAVTAARKRSIKRAAQIVSPVATTQATSAGQVLFASLVVVALYVVLENVGPLGGVLGAASKALQWLGDPTKSIPAKS